MNSSAKKITTLAMLAAMAFAAVACVHIPFVPGVTFLTYDPKDVIIAVGGFIFGPLAAVVVSLIVALTEMITFSSTGFIGMIMNVLSSVAFGAVSSGIYRRDRTLRGAGLGLAAAVAAQTGIMLLWNYFITPIYMGYPRETVAAMLIPVFLPFNLIKGGINAALTMLVYKPVVTALRKVRLVPDNGGYKGKASVWVILVSILLLASLVCLVLVFNGVI